LIKHYRLNDSPLVAIVILNWNGRRFLEQFLPSVIASGYAHLEIVVADNGSTDDSMAFMEEHYPTVRLERMVRNFGFAKGYNEALKKIRAEYYVLLNSDVEVTPGWLQPMVDLLESDPGIAACQPRIRSFKRRDEFDYAGAAGGWLDKYGYPFSMGRVFDHCEKDQGQYNEAMPIFWASGAALFIRATAFHEAGGFDEYFFAHQEEIDLCWRLQLAGHRIYSCPQSIVYHVGGGTLPRGRSLKTYLNFRNNRIMMSKNLPWQKKIWVMPARNFLDAVSAWKGLLSGDGGYFISVVRAQIGFIRWWLFHRKKSVFPRSRAGRLHGLYKGNIAWQHFARKKRTFREIVTEKP
jgi:GT2 family glycosyltransferase